MLYVATDQAHGTVVQWGYDSAGQADPGAMEPTVFTNYTSTPGVVLTGGLGDHTHSRDSGEHWHRARMAPTLLSPGSVAEFVSFRTFLLVTDSTDPERFGLSVRRLYRLWAPHALENPIFFHATNTTTAGFQLEVDQMAQVGFEMLIYSFGSGFDLENISPPYLAEIKAQVDYAKSKGIEVGGYDLICLQRGQGGYGGNVGLQWDTVLPDGSYGEDACFASGWVDRLTSYVYAFVNQTGLSMLETDGPYGGEPCASTNHSGHVGLGDSIYRQNRVQADFYSGLRERNVYINQPDNYFFQGGQRTGLGYNEDQFSLPRWQDVTISRMTIYDETYRKVPTMGWMFLPLVDYHGGGPDAAFEPPSQHLPEFEMALAQYLGSGIAACYRGWRLFDTPAAAAVVAKWVAVYKAYRPIITADIIHVRRPDGQSLDAFMHADARLRGPSGDGTTGFALVFNPTLFNLTQWVRFPLYYTGIADLAGFSQEGATPVFHALDRDYSVEFAVTLPPQSVTWFAISDGIPGA